MSDAASVPGSWCCVCWLPVTLPCLSGKLELNRAIANVCSTCAFLTMTTCLLWKRSLCISRFYRFGKLYLWSSPRIDKSVEQSKQQSNLMSDISSLTLGMAVPVCWFQTSSPDWIFEQQLDGFTGTFATFCHSYLQRKSPQIIVKPYVSSSAARMLTLWVCSETFQQVWDGLPWIFLTIVSRELIKLLCWSSDFSYSGTR